jgi:transglutaminase-like putative cysteine protease
MGADHALGNSAGAVTAGKPGSPAGADRTSAPVAVSPFIIHRFYQAALLGLVASGFLAVAITNLLDLPTTALMSAALLLRACHIAGIWRVEIPERAVLWATLGYILFYPLDFWLVSGDFVNATIHLIFFLAALRVLSARSQRDFVYVQLLALLEILAATILSGGLHFLVFLVIFLICGIATLLGSELYRASLRDGYLVRGGLRGLGRSLAFMSGGLTLGILVITAGFFFVLPRTARAAFQHLISSRYHVPGFSNSLTLGALGEIKQDYTAVMHVKMLSAFAPQNLKWRGSALTHFDGRRWFNVRDQADQKLPGDGRLVSLTRLRPSEARRFHYEVRVKDLATDLLFFAGKPEFLSIRVPVVWRTPVNGFRLLGRPAGSYSYVGYSYVDDIVFDRTPVEALSEAEAREYLRLPPLDSRFARLAERWAGRARTKEEEARAIEFGLQKEYRYTLDLGDRVVSDPLAHFLFERKRGHCEYFASAMAVLLRLRGIPSRVATGFQGGVYNPVSGWQVIRAADAHSWVEAYLPNRGWVTFDPTPPDPSPPPATLTTQMNFYLDAMETYWNDWVVGFDQDRQFTLAARFQDSSRSVSGRWLDRMGEAATWFRRDLPDLARRYGPEVFAAFLLIGALVWFGPRLYRDASARWQIRRMRSGAAGAPDAALLYQQMLRLLRRRGLEKPPWLTPAEFARMVPDPGRAVVVADFTAAYNEMRFGRVPGATQRALDALKRLENA